MLNNINSRKQHHPMSLIQQQASSMLWTTTPNARPQSFHGTLLPPLTLTLSNTWMFLLLTVCVLPSTSTCYKSDTPCFMSLILSSDPLSWMIYHNIANQSPEKSYNRVTALGIPSNWYCIWSLTLQLKPSTYHPTNKIAS